MLERFGFIFDLGGKNELLGNGNDPRQICRKNVSKAFVNLINLLAAQHGTANCTLHPYFRKLTEKNFDSPIFMFRGEISPRKFAKFLGVDGASMYRSER